MQNPMNLLAGKALDILLQHADESKAVREKNQEVNWITSQNIKAWEEWERIFDDATKDSKHLKATLIFEVSIMMFRHFYLPCKKIEVNGLCIFICHAKNRSLWPFSNSQYAMTMLKQNDHPTLVYENPSLKTAESLRHQSIWIISPFK